MITAPRSLQSRLFRLLTLWDKHRTDRVHTPVAQQRADIERLTRGLPPARGVRLDSVTVNGLYAEWLIPPDANTRRATLYLHGGWYAVGSCVTHRALVSRIAAATETSALLLEYRLAPEHPFPAALDDALGAITWLRQQGFDSINVMGDSAGGGLTLALLLKLRDRGEPLPRCAVVLSPFTDLTISGETAKTHIKLDPMNKPEDVILSTYYAGKHDPADPLLSPLFGDLHGLPPLLIQVGSDELLLSDSTRFAEKASATGGDVRLEVWDGMWHVWQLFAPFMPEANRAIQHIADFVRRV